MAFGLLGQILGKAVKALKLVLEIKEILQLILFLTGASIMSAILAFIREAPLWAIVLIALGVFFVGLIAVVLTKKPSYYGQLLKYPNILRAIDNRNRTLALQKVKHGIDRIEVEKLVKDLGGITKIARILSNQPLNKKQMNFIEKKIEQQINRDNLLIKVSELMDLHDLGLEKSQQKDLVFRYYREQLENMPLPPNLEIDSKLEDCLKYSYRFNNILILNKTYLKEMKTTLPVKYLLHNIRYAEFAKSKTRKLIVSVNQTIREYVNEHKHKRKNKM